MPDYSKSKIYKLVNNVSDDTYFGSTSQPLYKRLHQHKKKNNGCTSKILFEQGVVSIVLVEEVCCENRDQLKARERHYIENFNCINKNIPGRTQKEYKNQYKIDNKEQIKEYNKQYKIDNKEQIKEQIKEYKKEYNKQYYTDNKEYIKQYQSKHFICGCGSKITIGAKSNHLKTKKHTEYLNNNIEL